MEGDVNVYGEQLLVQVINIVLDKAIFHLNTRQLDVFSVSQPEPYICKRKLAGLAYLAGLLL